MRNDSHPSSLDQVPTALVSKDSPYIQIGQEIGQREWNQRINCPIPHLFPKTYFAFKGSLDQCAAASKEQIREVLRVANEHSPRLPVYVVYEAGAFGQKFGRDVVNMGAWPVQLVARNIEYVSFRKGQVLPKAERLDSNRQSELPLDRPELPYADVQTPEEEDQRLLCKSLQHLQTVNHQLNSQLCALFRRLHIDTRHRGIKNWSKLIEQADLPPEHRSMARMHLESLQLNTRQLYQIRKRSSECLKQARRAWRPPVAVAIPARPGRHPLRALSPASPLLTQSPIDALQQILGIGPMTLFTFLALVGDIRRFRNQKAFRAYCGLAPIPYCSGSMRKSLGMKRGNPVLRKLFIQLAWRWLRLQPDTPQAKRFHQRAKSRRTKKIAIAALAGELSTMIFGYLVHGKPLPGLNVKPH